MIGSAEWELFGTMLAGFFAIMNPIANVTVFLGLTDGLSSRERRRVALQSTLTAFVVVTCFAASGQFIFSLFGITVAAFRLSGGIIIFLIGYKMLQGERPASHHTVRAIKAAAVQGEPSVGDSATVDIGANDHVLSVAVSPLGVPLLAGPGTIATAVGFSVGAWTKVLITIAAVGVMCALTWLSFVTGERVVRSLGSSFLTVVTRLMGLILAVVGMQMFVEGFREAGL
ncbi:MAG: multiple antibiotic resistance protein [Myxococcaceae bacterium]|nr:multiple antibiotic resistance protein [Myxococcaceae bacterium]